MTHSSIFYLLFSILDLLSSITGVAVFERQVYQIHHARPGVVPGARVLRLGRRKRMDVVMETAPGFVKAVSAGEDQVGELEQFSFTLFSARRRGFARFARYGVWRFIHAIIYHKERIETPGE